jgi:hypothetical protein
MDSQHDGFYLQGRGDFEASWEPYPGGVRIRLDDKKAPEFWAEVLITIGTLETMLDKALAEKRAAWSKR